MSNDENPFGSSEPNPFGDPAIQSATKNVQMTQQSLDDYNPFAEKNYQSKPAAIIPTASGPTPVSSSNQYQSFQSPSLSDQMASSSSTQPPTYMQTSAQKLNLNDIEKQQDELNRRAAELERREQMLQSPAGGTTANNFPPLPSWCPGPLKPCFYQDISREIPVDFQRWVRVLFYLWLFHIFTLAFNMLAAFVVLVSLGVHYVGVFGFSIFYFVLFSPLSYVCWFRPAYKGFRSDSSVDFMLFFFVFFMQSIFSVISCFSGSWFCGIVLLVDVLSKQTVNNIVSGVFVLLACICFIAVAAADILMLIKVHRLYRSTGASFEKAQAEFATNVMSNKNVQNAAATVVTESARATMQGQTYGSSTGKF